MFGMEKEQGKKYVFDLEKEIKADPSRGKKILENVEKKVHAIKKQLREGANEKEFDQLGILLSGYSALQKVLKRIGR